MKTNLTKILAIILVVALCIPFATTLISAASAEMTIAEALAATDGTEVTVTGTVTEINTPWSDSFGNISVTITDENGDQLYLYRLATKVERGDVITVTGTMATYNSNRQVAAGATAEIIGHEDLGEIPYEEVTVAEAIALDDDALVKVTGTVTNIAGAWNASYGNMNVYITDANGDELYLYRLATEVAEGDVIVVCGKMDTYNGNRQVIEGTATPYVAPETDADSEVVTEPAPSIRSTTGFIYFDNVVDGTFTSQGNVSTLLPDSRWAKVESATPEGYGMKITRTATSLGGQTIFDFTNTFNIITDHDTQVAVRCKIVGSGSDVDVVVRNTSGSVQGYTTITPTGDWQTVIIDVPWGALNPGANQRINFAGESIDNYEIYLDWLVASHYYREEGSFAAVIAAEEAASADLWEEIMPETQPPYYFNRPQSQNSNIGGVTVDTRRLAYFDNVDVEAKTFINGNALTDSAAGSVWGTYGVKLAPGQTRLEWISTVYMIHGATTFVRYKVVNADPSFEGGNIRFLNWDAGSIGVSYEVGAPTGDWQWAIDSEYTSGGNFLNANQKGILVFPDFGENAEIYIDVAGTIPKTADADGNGLDDGFEAFKAVMDANWANIPGAETPGEDESGSETDPVESTPAETTPAETTPAETTPAETTPAETTPAETDPPLDPNRNTNASGAGFMYFDNLVVDGENGTFTSLNQTILVQNNGKYTTASVATEEGYGIKLVKGSTDIGQMLFDFHPQGYPNFITDHSGRYITIRFKIVNAGTDIMSVRIGNAGQNIYDSETFEVEDDWQVVTAEWKAWGALHPNIGPQSINFSSADPDAPLSNDIAIYIDYIGVVWGEGYQEAADAEAAKQDAFWETLTLVGAGAPGEEPETELHRNTIGFIYFDNVTANGFTSQGTENPFVTANFTGNTASASDKGLGLKLTNAGFAGQTIFDFTNNTGTINDHGNQLAIRVKIVNSGLDTMSVTVRNATQGGDCQNSATFEPTGEWQVVYLDATRWGVIHPGHQIRINFGGEIAANCEIYVDWLGISYQHGNNFGAAVEAEVNKSLILWDEAPVESDTETESETTPVELVTSEARMSDRVVYFDNVIKKGNDTYITTSAGVEHKLTGATAGFATLNEGFGLKLPVGVNTVKIAKIGFNIARGDIVVIRYAVANSDFEGLASVNIYNAFDASNTKEIDDEIGDNWPLVMTPTGDWEYLATVVTTANGGAFASATDTIVIEFPDFGDESYIVLDFIGFFADENAAAAEIIAQEAFWADYDLDLPQLPDGGEDESETTPGGDESETVPGGDESETVPGGDESETTPGEGESESTPGEGDSESTPGEGESESTPGEGESESTPGEGESDTDPTEDESDTDPTNETDPVETESTPVGETESQTNAPATETEGDAKGGCKGCKSSVGIGAVAIVALIAGGALALRKKED